MKKRLMLILLAVFLVASSGRDAQAQLPTIQSKLGSQYSVPSTKQQTSATTSTQTTPGTAEEVLPEGMTRITWIDQDIKEIITQITTLMPDKKFILNDKVRGKITVIADEPMRYDMVYEAFLSALEINGFTIVETPAGLLNIVQKKDSLTKPTDLYKSDNSLVTDEHGKITDKYITRIVQLTNISAKEIQSIVDGMKSDGGRVTPYPTTNSLIITDTGSNINHMLRIIQELDQEGPQEQIQIIPIINADAKDIASKIKDIFETDKGDQNTALARRQIFRRGAQQTELEDVQAISKVIEDERTNSIIIMGTRRSIDKVRDLIAKLDRSIEGIEGTIHVYYLSHANAKEMAEVLTNLASAKTSSTSKTTTTTSRTSGAQSTTGVELEGGVKVTADEATNSLVITASPKDFTTLVDKVIAKLDIVRLQVYLEAVVMSLDVSKTTTIGVSGNGGFLNTTAGGNQFTTFGSVLPVAPTAISSIAGAAGGFGGGIVSSDSVTFTLADGSSVSIPAISGILQALQADTDVNVLSTPSILTMDNQKAEIVVGQNVPVPSGTTVSTGVTTFNVTRQDVGIKLIITPQISESDTVRLEIEQEISGIAGLDANLGPTLDKKNVKTVVVAKNKQTIVIGGLIDDSNVVTTQKIPLLGDIPVLGNLFKNKITAKNKSNVIVFITPYIIKERKDYLAILKKKIEERNAFVDMNFGTGQRKQIRQAIQSHARDLLDFKCADSDMGDPCMGYEQGLTNSQPVISTNANYSEKSVGNEYNPRLRRKKK